LKKEGCFALCERGDSLVVGQQ